MLIKLIISVGILVNGCTASSSLGKNNETLKSILGTYKPTKRVCFNKQDIYCMKKITLFEFSKGTFQDLEDSSIISFVIWSPRISKKPVNQYRLVANNRIALSKDISLDKNQTIILENYHGNDGNYLQKVEFLDNDHGIYTSDHNGEKNILYFKRINNEEMKQYIKIY